MFGQFREKIQAVQQDLSDGLKNLSVKAQKVSKTNRSSENSTTKYDNLPSLRDGLHISAGADLLDYFQGHWTNIHEDLEDCAKRATEADVLIQQISLSQEKQFAEWRVIERQLQEVPALLEEIQKITAEIGKLTADFEEVEAALVDLEDVTEEEEYYRNEAIQRKELENYKKQKVHEEELLRARLQDEFDGKLLEKQKEEDAHKRERQQAFQEFFADDLKHYKEFGKVERPTEVAAQEAHLEDFELEWDEYDQKALNDFLGPPEDQGPLGTNEGSNAVHEQSPENDKSGEKSDKEDDGQNERDKDDKQEEDSRRNEMDQTGEAPPSSEDHGQENATNGERVVPGGTSDKVEETNSGCEDGREPDTTEHDSKEDGDDSDDFQDAVEE